MYKDSVISTTVQLRQQYNYGIHFISPVKFPTKATVTYMSKVVVWLSGNCFSINILTLGQVGTVLGG